MARRLGRRLAGRPRRSSSPAASSTPAPIDGDRLVGYVNVAWDGGQHAFLLDTSVHPDFQRRGVATALVRLVTDAARARGAAWLHVDYEPHLDALLQILRLPPHRRRSDQPHTLRHRYLMSR